MLHQMGCIDHVLCKPESRILNMSSVFSKTCARGEKGFHTMKCTNCSSQPVR